MDEFCICHLCGSVSLDGWENDYCTPTCDDCADEDWRDEYDGQPDELTEWMDYDPDC